MTDAGPFTERVSIALTEEQLCVLELRAQSQCTTVAALLRDEALRAHGLQQLIAPGAHRGGGARSRATATEAGLSEFGAAISKSKAQRRAVVQLTREQLGGLKRAARAGGVTLSELLRAAAGLERVGSWGGAGRGGGRKPRTSDSSAS